MVPERPLLDRFARDLDALIAPDARIGIAVSGGPDSFALLLLAVAARPGRIEAATVDHALRDGSRAEAEMVAGVCADLDVPHAILTAQWNDKPATAIQERARQERYRLLAHWANDRRLGAIATAHHLDDQAETLLMRLNRGAGVRGLAGMRAASRVPGSDVSLLRPLLGWRRTELEQIVAVAGLEPVRDPSNEDKQFERVRVRRALAEADWLDPQALAASAAHVGDADAALDWIAESLALARVTDDADGLRIDASGLPAELQHRLMKIAFARFHAPEPRGAEFTRALDALAQGRSVTLSDLKLEGGPTWRITKAPRRRVTSRPCSE
jgi:tRNA(Ile)-lysidine synthase